MKILQTTMLAVAALASQVALGQEVIAQQKDSPDWYKVVVDCDGTPKCLCVLANDFNDAAGKASQWGFANCADVAVGFPDKRADRGDCEAACGTEVIIIDSMLKLRAAPKVSPNWVVRVDVVYCDGRTFSTHAGGATCCEALCNAKTAALSHPSAPCGIRCWSFTVVRRPCCNPCNVCQPVAPHRPVCRPICRPRPRRPHCRPRRRVRLCR